MMKSWTICLILLLGSVIMSALFWIAGLPFFFLLLFVPLIPLVFGREKTRRCPVCGWETTGNERFCPYGAALLNDISCPERKDE
ncbi:MAG: hypothetical protein WC379_06000 [Methanoregula sp.]|jgi:hypothetical protein